jgi:hypothetical protein
MKQATSIEIQFADGSKNRVEGKTAEALWRWIAAVSRTECCHCGSNYPGGLTEIDEGRKPFARQCVSQA